MIVLYNVLIAEDELLVRLGLKNSVQWANHGMKVIGDVADGNSALQVYQEEKPDLIITDIKMPIMNGMELIEKIRANDSATRIIILSCVEDFELLRQAIKLGITGYILKLTMTTAEIDDILRKAKFELDAIQKRVLTSVSSHVDRDLLIENTMKNYMLYRMISEADFVQALSDQQCRITPVRLVLCTMEFDYFEDLKKKFKDHHGKLVRYSMLNVFNELLTGYGNGEVFQDKDHRYIFLFSFQEIVSENDIIEYLSGIIEHIRKVMLRFFNISTSFGISTIRNGYSQLPVIYEESNRALQEKFFGGTGLNYFYRKATETDDNSVALKIQSILSTYLISDESRDKQHLIWSEMLANDRPEREQLLRTTVRAMEQLLNESRERTKSSAFEIQNIIDRLHATETVVDLFQTCKRFIQALLQHDAQHPTSSNKVVDSVMRYIHQHLDTDLSVSRLAEIAEVTPNYLSHIFKKKTDSGVVQFVHRIRLEKAKHLLLTTNLRLYEIAEKVGFRDENYFSRVFSKYYKIRPNELRKKEVQNKQEDQE